MGKTSLRRQAGFNNERKFPIVWRARQYAYFYE